jgi:hypothetical protein
MSQKLFSEYNKGDPVMIASAYELEQFFSYYGGNKTGVDIDEIANQIGTIAWIPNKDELQSWDGMLPVIIPSGQVVTLPFAALGEISGPSSDCMVVEEPDDSDGEVEVEIVRDKASEYGMVQNFAAETIQETYRYRFRCHFHCAPLHRPLSLMLCS